MVRVNRAVGMSCVKVTQEESILRLPCKFHFMPLALKQESTVVGMNGSVPVLMIHLMHQRELVGQFRAMKNVIFLLLFFFNWF